MSSLEVSTEDLQEIYGGVGKICPALPQIGLTRLKRLSVFKAVHRLKIFAQFHKNLILLLQRFLRLWKVLQNIARFCMWSPNLLTIILTLNSSNTSLV